MASLTWIVFESVLALGAVLGLALFVLLVRWRRGGSVRPLLIGLGVSTVLLVMQAVVVTHRERASAALTAIADDFEKGRTTALETQLGSEFAAGTLYGEALTRARFLELIRDLLAEIRVVRTQRVDLDVETAASDGFVVEVGYLAEISKGENRGVFRSRWALTFARTAEGWRIVSIEPLSIEGMPTPSWDRIARE